MDKTSKQTTVSSSNINPNNDFIAANDDILNSIFDNTENDTYNKQNNSFDLTAEREYVPQVPHYNKFFEYNLFYEFI